MAKGRNVRREDGLRKAREEALARSAASAAVLAALFFEGNMALGQTPPPQESGVAAGSTVTLHGFVDAYATWNPNRPSDRNNFEPGTGTTAEKANQFGLNLAALDVSLDAKPVGFHIVGVAGTGTDVVHAAELHVDTWRHVSQASVSYRLDAGRGVLFELGIQPSHIGYEGFFSKDNWNYTRGWMGEFSPYYQTGLKVATSFDDHWSGQLWLLNGWQNIEDNNDGKAIGTQIAYAKDALGLTVNTFFGPELANDDAHWRSFVDFVGTLKISSKVNIAASVDLGRQTRPQAAAASWQGASLWLQYLLRKSSSSSSSPSLALALRVEVFHDPDAAVSPVSQTLFGSTLTFELRPHPQVILKLEGRYDRSTADAFGGPDGPLTKREEFLLALGAVATF
ncbi:MAG TPA: porin [Thermoanaerobaculia bacterium]|nr:porin [Thermoanaerobaculia bacterium]